VSEPSTQAGRTTSRPPDSSGPSLGDLVPYLLAGVIMLLIITRGSISSFLATNGAVAAWLTVFVSIGLQALPFLVMGVALSALIAVYVPADVLARWLPRRPGAAVPVAGLSGLVLPGCECASVPIAGSLMSRGIKPAAALTFLLAAPAINPIVLVSTAVAFNGRYEFVAARFVASLLVAVVMGWLWLIVGDRLPLRIPRRHSHGSTRLGNFVGAAGHDLFQAGGFLVIGSAVAATVNVLVPREWIDSIAGSLLLSVLILAVFAVIVAVCSEADAFIAASLSQFPPTAQLAFMVVGPAVDVKLFAMQAGTFGKSFALRFAPATFVVAVLMSLLVGGLLL
jgi:uncharacterized protein